MAHAKVVVKVHAKIVVTAHAMVAVTDQIVQLTKDGRYEEC